MRDVKVAGRGARRARLGSLLLCAVVALLTAYPALADSPSGPGAGLSGPPRGARSATLAGGTAARSGEAASTARGGS